MKLSNDPYAWIGFFAGCLVFIIIFGIIYLLAKIILRLAEEEEKMSKVLKKLDDDMIKENRR